MIPLFKVHTPPNIGETLQNVWSSGMVTEGEHSDEFERKFGEYIKNPNTALTNSCTSALTLAAHLCGVGPETEVITTAMTCLATNAPFVNMGADLVFADIDYNTGNISPESIEKQIRRSKKKIAAIVVVHWGGQPCDMNAITAIGNKYGIKVIEDAAHALRSEYDGKLIGNHGDYVCFSFQAIKHLTTGDGGAIACKSKEDYERIKRLRWYGLDRHYKGKSRWEQNIAEVGYKFHMNNINASIGIEQMKYIDDIIDKHIEHSLYYDEHIDNPRIKSMRRDSINKSSEWIYTIRTSERERLKEYLIEKGIGCDRVHVSNDQYSAFERRVQTALENTHYFDEQKLCIPVGWWLSEENIYYIVSSLNNYS